MSDRPDLNRRRLLAGAPLLGASVVLATDADRGTAAEQDANPDPRAVTFHETEHVKTFYRLARDN